MKIDVVPLPSALTDEDLRGRTVVVFDVLRATTTIAAAMSAGAAEIRVFDSLDAAQSAASCHNGPMLLCGESKCLPPEGFDLGNSPGAYQPERVRGKTLFLSTTNGTRALVAARGASLLLTGALVNAHAIARTIQQRQLDTTLLCAGTDGESAPEDLLGAGAVLAHLVDRQQVEFSPAAHEVERTFLTHSATLLSELHKTEGGQNVIRAGLVQDIEFAARLNVFEVTPRCDGETMSIRAMSPA